MREVIFIQVGQCGNQIGAEYWKQLLAAHKSENNTIHFYETPSGALRARCLAIDMEEGVLSAISSEGGALHGLVDDTAFVVDLPGSGNNWARGFCEHGRIHGASIEESLRRQSERCDSLDGFILTHSAGGGTGSGLGSWVMEHLSTNYPEAHRVSGIVLPSANDDVITSPYNATLTLGHLADTADLIIPFENEKLLQIAPGTEERPFSSVNSVIASAMSGLTLSPRRSGPLNVDFSDLVTNLVPFSHLNYAVPSISPITLSKYQEKSLGSCLRELCRPDNWHITVNTKYTFLSTAIIGAGPRDELPDLLSSFKRIQQDMPYVWWNTDGFKTGYTYSDGQLDCFGRPSGTGRALIGLFNTTAISGQLETLIQRFDSLFRRKLYLHHFEEFLSQTDISTSAATLKSVRSDYRKWNGAKPE